MYQRSFALIAATVCVLLGAAGRADAQYAMQYGQPQYAPALCCNQPQAYQPQAYQQVAAQPAYAPAPPCVPRRARGLLEALVNLTDDPPCSTEQPGYVLNQSAPQPVQPYPAVTAAPEEDGGYDEPVRPAPYPRYHALRHRHVAADVGTKSGPRTIYADAILRSDGRNRMEITILRRKHR